MDESETQKTKRKIDRVELLPETLERLSNWQKQIDQVCPEVMVTKKDLANWVILEHKETLSDGDLRKIRERFFDSVQYLKSLLKKVEAAKALGKNIELEEIAIPITKPRKSRSNQSEIESPVKEKRDQNQIRKEL